MQLQHPASCTSSGRQATTSASRTVVPRKHFAPPRSALAPPRATSNKQFELLLEAALQEARANNFETARSCFRDLTEAHPQACKAFVSWAQMEKRMTDGQCVSRCRAVLQEGLRVNPSSACLIQAWGLLELQRGNWLAALMMLERAVKIEPKYFPVLRWQQVHTARRTVGSSPRRAHSLSGHTQQDC